MASPPGERKKCVVCDRTVFIGKGARECSSCVEKTLRIYKKGAPLGQAESQMFAQVLENYGDAPEWPDVEEFPAGDAGLTAIGVDPGEWKRQVRETPVLFDGEAPGSSATDAWEGLRLDLADAVSRGKKSLLALLLTSVLAGALIGSLLLLLIALQIGGRIK